jgi:hypothetical protein
MSIYTPIDKTPRFTHFQRVSLTFNFELVEECHLQSVL